MAANDPAKAPEELDFEAALEALEAITRQVESGALPLDETVSAFEAGVALTARCREHLAAAEGRIQKLVDDGKLEAFPLTEPG